MSSPQDLCSVRDRLGKVGVWLGALARAPIPHERIAARRIEELGYGSLWCGEIIGGKEAFAHQSVLLAATNRIMTGTGIANVWSRHPAAMQGGAATLWAAYPGRFILGIGISHAPIVERSGQIFERPLAHMTAYLDGMDAAVKYAPASDIPVPRVLAALRAQMLSLARERTDGAHSYFVPPSHTTIARNLLGKDKLLITEQAVLLQKDKQEARRVARGHMETYLKLSNYANNLKQFGFNDEDFASGGSNRLVDAIVAWGDEATIAERVQEHLDAGADHVLLQPLGSLEEAITQLARLTEAVLGR